MTERQWWFWKSGFWGSKDFIKLLHRWLWRIRRQRLFWESEDFRFCNKILSRCCSSGCGGSEEGSFRQPNFLFVVNRRKIENISQHGSTRIVLWFLLVLWLYLSMFHNRFVSVWGFICASTAEKGSGEDINQHHLPLRSHHVVPKCPLKKQTCAVKN